MTFANAGAWKVAVLEDGTDKEPLLDRGGTAADGCVPFRLFRHPPCAVCIDRDEGSRGRARVWERCGLGRFGFYRGKEADGSLEIGEAEKQQHKNG